MDFDIANQHAQTGHKHRRRGNFVEAGEYYTATGHQYFSEWAEDPHGKKISQGEYFFLLAGTCYRLGGQPDRAVARCEQGILIAEELLDRTKDFDGSTAYDTARYGAWYEYIGDFRLVGGSDGAMEAYEQAKQVYLDEDDPPLAHREQEHMWLTEFWKQVACSVGYDADEWQKFVREATLSEWVEFKQNRLPDALDTLTSESEWSMLGEK
ncbi:MULTISPECIES: hypothetical protein [Halorussus]|uniref:hypothetical protein n=1 Tax=Halorussus TaxID=1070314 RepID=UPI00209E13FB|nr:hypothetical protein [Halorussus vallis]USZ74942.1 hypothetical protein NGM07_16065 [Halorussus vallis]